ncbi:unnamed protein product, partial [Mesorhabditis belari]|uniref:polo kinase n=1 Tax=Mesorhabditis belari TaxID=2138241 RepID=A0AAF3F228_9BILA
MEKGDDRKKTLCGTPNYIAPEVLEKTGHAFEVDVWALGCILYTLLVGTPPFETKSLQETYRRIKSNQYRIPSTIGNTAAKVIRELLAANPASRPKIAEVKKYAYFAEYTPTHLPTSCLTLPPKFSKMSSDCYAQELFNKLRATLLKGGTRNISPIEDLAEAPECMPVFWVSKWVDYSDKYGIGYQLCDNSVGVLYNDNSRLVLDAAGLNLQYVERDNYEEYFMMNKDLERMKHLEKKTTLLKFFRDYMNQHLLKAGEKFAPKEGDELARLPCLRSWFRTGSAIVLHLTNGTLQINFFNDHTKLILCPHLGAVTFIDREKKLRTFKLELLETHGFDVDLRSRLKYAEGMIERLMAKTNGTTKSEVSSTSGQVAWSSGVSSLKAKPQSSQI